MRKLILALVVTTSATVRLVPAHADDTTLSYVALPHAMPSDQVFLIAPGARFGNAVFPGRTDGKIPVGIRIADATGGDVSFDMCQSLSGGHTCGNTGTIGALEPNFTGCGRDLAVISQTGVPFDPALSTTVFVSMFDTGVRVGPPSVPATPTTCGPATTGTITITYQ